MNNKILDGKTIRENVGIAVGYASRCWDENEVFDTTKSVKIMDELVEYIETLLERRTESVYENSDITIDFDGDVPTEIKLDLFNGGGLPQTIEVRKIGENMETKLE